MRARGGGCWVFVWPPSCGDDQLFGRCLVQQQCTAVCRQRTVPIKLSIGQLWETVGCMIKGSTLYSVALAATTESGLMSRNFSLSAKVGRFCSWCCVLCVTYALCLWQTWLVTFFVPSWTVWIWGTTGCVWKLCFSCGHCAWKTWKAFAGYVKTTEAKGN